VSVDLERLLEGLIARVSGFLQESLGNIVAVSRAVVGGFLAAVFMLFFILMVAAFFSIDSVKVRRYWQSLVPPEHLSDVEELTRRIDRSLAGVVRGQVTICLVNGVLTLLGLWIFGVKFAFLLATVATVLSLIPIFGAIISSVPIVIIGLSQSWKVGLGMLAWILGIHALEAYFLNPKIMGSAARIHPVVVAFALIAGERTFGLVGALFAVPMAAIVVGCFEFARQKASSGTVG
jgi:predicted PurR-regulated permease PerM